ncbi:uncharacterized protein LOC115981006 [Quercus lobata]|uniref:uncharacterized protein LOC115981006 n=1 Tax=Quercus lobata TaxID=97700 RepID=UPI0012491D0C|nr:uncharacterized protein LOC115981006 [Quercus lobata]
MSPNTATLFSMVAWSIWTRRNKLRERKPIWDVGETVKREKELLQEFKDLQDFPSWYAIPRVEVRWKPPGTGLFKINFDGAVFEDRALVGLGIVIEDESGLIIAALSQKIPLPSSVEMVEALAVRRGNKLAHSLAKRAVLAADTDVWLEELPQDLIDVFQFDLA